MHLLSENTEEYALALRKLQSFSLKCTFGAKTSKNRPYQYTAMLFWVANCIVPIFFPSFFMNLYWLQENPVNYLN